jgi:hypothetical protein
VNYAERNVPIKIKKQETQKYYETFSQETWTKLTSTSTSVLKHFQDYGLSKQLLCIGVTECEEVGSVINWFFRCMQCFELNIYVTSDATEQNTQKYLEYLASKIKEQRLSHIVFSNFNPFFETIPELGFIADPTNKAVTGPFKYRIFLP